jgi:DMSO/TMAO reductase YedYZ molybdopterin-dependent catalytic subunit
MVVSSINNQVVDGHWTVKWINQIEVQSVGQTWSLDLRGAIITPVDRGSYQSCSAPACHGVEWQDENGQTWEGVPLWLLAGQVDDENSHGDFSYNQELADAGYTVDVIASDGYSVSFESAILDHNSDILLAYLVNSSELPEQYYPLRLVGPGLENNQMVGQVVQVIVNVPALPTPTAPAVVENTAPMTITGMVNQELSLTEADLRLMEIMTITAEHARLGIQTYQGVSLNSLLELAGIKDGATKLVFTASDGYVTEVALSDVTSCVNSLLAFTEIPGSFLVVLPDMASQNWVKDLVNIEVK